MENNKPAQAQGGTAKSRTLFFLALAVLVLPLLVFFFFWFSGETVCEPLHVYKDPAKSALGDSVALTIPEFRFTDQKGATVTRDDLRGKIHVADFFFTTCPSICIPLSKQMKKLQDELDESEDQSVRLVSYSVDPERDSVAALAAYADRYGANYDRWRLLTTDSDSLMHDFIRSSYLQAAYRDTANAQHPVTHSNMYVLVDKELRVRGFYPVLNGMDPNDAELQRLRDEINVLACEYRNKGK